MEQGISLIIPSYRGHKKISNILSSVFNQSLLPNEIIIVIDHEDEKTENIVLNEFDNHLINISKIKNQSRANTRNEGAWDANFDLLVFYDDDTRLEKHSLEKHFRFLKLHTNALVSGQVPEDLNKCYTDFQFYKAYLSRKWTEKTPLQITNINTYLTAANFSIPKSLFEKLGGFDENLSDAEDFDLATRALKQGYQVFFDKSNIAWHDDYITCRKYIARQRQYAIAHSNLLRLKPELYNGVNERKLKMNFFKKIIFSFCAQRYWIKLIDKEKLTLLPRKIRYKIYDLVITGMGKVYTDRSLY